MSPDRHSCEVCCLTVTQSLKSNGIKSEVKKKKKNVIEGIKCSGKQRRDGKIYYWGSLS